MDSVKKLRQFIKHWYMRYLVSTELYMVEPWEKVVIHKYQSALALDGQ